MSDVPDWAKDDPEAQSGGGGGGGAAAAAPAAGSGDKKKKGIGARMDEIQHMSTSKVLRLMRSVNVLNGLAMALMSLFVMGDAAELDIAGVLVGAYVVFFGVLLMIIECNFSNVQNIVRRLFGFMFTYAGRTFCATVCFTMASVPGYIVGAGTAANVFFNLFVLYKHPAFVSGALSRDGNPYSHYTGGESEMRDYVKRNPQLAKKAVKAGVGFARENPAAAGAIARGAVQAHRDVAAANEAAGSDNPFEASGGGAGGGSSSGGRRVV